MGQGKRWPYPVVQGKGGAYPVVQGKGGAYPMGQGAGKGGAHPVVGLEELVGEVLGEEGEHQIGSLRVRPELLPDEEARDQLAGVRQHGPP